MRHYLERKEGKRAESKAAQGLKSKISIMENLFGLKGQEWKKRAEKGMKTKKTPS